MFPHCRSRLFRLSVQLVVESQIEISYMFDETKLQAQTRFSCPVTNSLKLLKSNPCQVVIDDTSDGLD